MISTLDHQGPEKAYGWTKDEDGEVWYWEWDGEEVSFTERGTHTDHPIRRTGRVPDEIREHAETHVSALIERQEIGHY